MENYLSPFIALIGVVVAGFVSFLVSKATVTTQVMALRYETKRIYEMRLVEARLGAYPELYRVLSEFIKSTHKEPPTAQNLQIFLDVIERWDSNHAILFSVETASICYNYRSMLHKILKLSDPAIVELFNNYSKCRVFRDDTAALEFALKSDLGIYGIESQETDSFGLRFVGSFNEVAAKVDARRNVGAKFYQSPDSKV